MTKNREKNIKNDAEVAGNSEKPAKSPLFDLASNAPALGSPAAPPAVDPLAGRDLNGLLELRALIDSRLPALDLASMDLEEELLLQFARTKELYNDIVSGNDTPANQKAQVANSITAILRELTEMQVKLYGAERTKALESAVIRTMKAMPEDVQKKFFEVYERALEALGVPPPPTLTPTPAVAAEAA